MSLSDPTKKMSKSDESNKGCIYLLDDPKVAYKKVMSAVTDSFAKVAYDPINQPGISNLLVIHSSLSGIAIEDIVKQFENEGYGTFKKAVAEEVVKLLENLQAKYHEIMSKDEVHEALRMGEAKAKMVAHETLIKVQKAVGIEI